MNKESAGIGTIAPNIRFFWEGRWPGGRIEYRRRIYDCELVYLSTGRLDLEIAGEMHHLSSGTVVIIPPMTLHQSYVPQEAEAIRHCIHFDWHPGYPKHQAPLWTWEHEPFTEQHAHIPPEGIARRLPLIINVNRHAIIADALELTLQLLRRGNELAPLQLAVVLQGLFQAAEHGVDGASHKSANEGMTRLLKHIEENYMEDLGHADFCRISGLSSSRFYTIFQKTVGSRPLTYLHRIRVRNAQFLLINRQDSIAAISRRVGFPDPNYFSRIFHKFTGMRPKEFRSAGKATKDGFRNMGIRPQRAKRSS